MTLIPARNPLTQYPLEALKTLRPRVRSLLWEGSAASGKREGQRQGKSRHGIRGKRCKGKEGEGGGENQKETKEEGEQKGQVD